MKDIKSFICESSDVEFPDVLDAFKDWVGPMEAQKIYDEIFSEIFNAMNDGAKNADEIKKELIKYWK